MKVLRNLQHNGVSYQPGQPFNVEVVTDEQHQALSDQLHLNRNTMPVWHAPTPVEQLPVQGKISTTDLAALIEGGIVSMDDNAEVPKGPMGARDVQDQNRAMWRDDRSRWAQIKAEQLADRAANLAAPVVGEPPAPKAVKGNAADAAAADAAAKAALAAQGAPDPAATAPAAPPAPASETPPAADAAAATPANGGPQS